MEKIELLWVLNCPTEKIYYGPIPEPKKPSSLNYLFVGMGGGPFCNYAFFVSRIKAEMFVDGLKKENYLEFIPII